MMMMTGVTYMWVMAATVCVFVSFFTILNIPQ